MGLLKGHIQDWLEEYGYDKGYDWDNLPDLSDMTPDCPDATDMFHCTVRADMTKEELESLADGNPDDGSWVGR